jgi:hypothetical protein
MPRITEEQTMDRILKDLFGDEPDPSMPPSTQTAAAEQAPDASGKRTDAEREARREARHKRRGDAEARRKRKEFVDRYTTGDPSEGFSTEEAITHLREMREEMSPAEFRAAMAKTLEHLPADQRDEFVAMMRQHKATQAMPGTAAASATGMSASSTADPFGGLLTGLMGSGTASAAPVGVGDIFEDLTKGGLSSPRASADAPPSQEDFTALLNSPIGRAVLGGLAAYGMQGMQTDDDDKPTPNAKRE